MAQVVLGVGTSHGPQVIVPPELWELRVPADKANPQQYYKGRSYTWEELARLRGVEQFIGQITAEEKRARSARCMAAAQALRDAWRAARIDAAVILGNDQFELFDPANAAMFTVYWGETVDAIPKTPEQLLKVPEGARPAEAGYTPPERTTYGCHPALGLALLKSLMAQGFDVAQSKMLPVGRMGNNGVPHAYGYVYRRVMSDAVVPHVPLFVNTHYPPNRPGAARCVAFGRALARAIAAWPGDARIAVIASGGMSHYVIDEEFDRDLLAAMARGDEARLGAIDASLFESGTAEVLDWLVLFGAMRESGLGMTLADYVPCYRSEAGTGNAMAFAHWSA